MTPAGTLPRLRVEITQKLQQVYRIRDRLTIGRAPDNDMQLLHPGVSRQHAEVVYDGEKLTIRDLGSRNGTFVNGQRVEEKVLKPGDEISIGQATLFVPEAEPEVPSENIFDLRHGTIEPSKLEEVALKSHIGIVAPTEREAVDTANAIGERFVLTSPLDELTAQSVVFALREATSNAERHGNKHQPGKLIHLSLYRDNEELVITVEDEGPGFDFVAELRRSEEGDAIHSARERYMKGGIGGLGIRLMLKCMDRIEYQKDGSRLVLVKRLTPQH